ncbi:MAG: hypothetical protein IMW89_00255 [Ktedonobacteraceae bacterium]|nr:hypothetical protein [Ktedonobacteraceae bacterium]
MTDRLSLVIILVIALLAWSGLLLFTYFVPPEANLATFAAFFLILGVALTGTLAPIAYMVGSRVLTRGRYRVTTRQSIRQAALLALAVMLNLALLALHSWNIAMALVTLGAAIVVEVLFLARK